MFSFSFALFPFLCREIKLESAQQWSFLASRTAWTIYYNVALPLRHLFLTGILKLQVT